MKKRVIAIILIVIIIAGVLIWYFYPNNEETENNMQEYQPQEEITNEQMRQTIVTLYFKNKETNQLVTEGKLIDSKLLLTDPYKELIELLIEGPKNEKFESTIPEGTKINKVELRGNTVYVDLSKEFIENHIGGEEAEKLTVYSIVNTLTELTEVENVKFLIDGEENIAFKDNKIKFDNLFSRLES